MDNLALRFIRWSAGLLMLGLLTGYGPLGHYLMAGVAVACPWAPVHAHVALLGWLGMAVFGLVYKALLRTETEITEEGFMYPPLALVYSAAAIAAFIAFWPEALHR